MKKIVLLLTVLLLLTSCSDDRLRTKVCTHVNDESHTTLTTYYNHKNDEVNSIIFELNQTLSETSVKGKNEEEVLDLLENIMDSSLNKDTQREIEYNHINKQAYIKITLFIHQMNEDELASINLQVKNDIDNLIKKFKSLGYKCK